MKIKEARSKNKEEIGIKIRGLTKVRYLIYYFPLLWNVVVTASVTTLHVHPQ